MCHYGAMPDTTDIRCLLALSCSWHLNRMRPIEYGPSELLAVGSCIDSIESIRSASAAKGVSWETLMSLVIFPTPVSLRCRSNDT
eukprot:IDg17343t1